MIDKYGKAAVLPSTSSLPGRLALANLSLGMAFGISALFSPDGRMLHFFGVDSALRIIPHFQQHLTGALVNYWIPATVIYLAARLLRVDTKLRPTGLINAAFGLANCFLILYIAARVFASTVEGGGGSFVVMSLAPFIIIPSWILLSAAFLWLVIRSILRQKTDMMAVPPRPRDWTRLEVITIGLAFAAPAVFVFALPLEKMHAMITGFKRLCEKAEVKVIERVNGAKGVALLPDRFSVMREEKQAETGPWAGFLLNQSVLEFIERPATKESGLAGTAKYERMTTAGERVLSGLKKRTRYAFEPTDVLTAEFEVRAVPLTVERGAEVGIGGSRVEIRRRSDGRMIAYAQYYWNNREFKACPPETHNGLFIYHFIAGALNVKNLKDPDGIK
ncbi:MAG: hypothetical protein ACREUB_00460 [Burkholderiales bacterium]